MDAGPLGDAPDLRELARIEAELDRDTPFRTAVASAFGGAAAPSSLRAQVAAATREHFDAVELRAAHRLAPAHTARPNALAVAASLLLVCGAVLFGIFGPRIGTTVQSGNATSVADVAAVVVSEHEQCTVHQSCNTQLAPWRSTAEASRELSRVLGREVRVPDLERAGFSFCSGGQTTIPGAGSRSGHLMYCRMVGDSCAWLSVFVAPVETRFLASDALGRTGPLDCTIHYYEFLAPGAGEIFYFCDGVVTWFVKPSDPTDFEIVRHFFPDSFPDPFH